MARVFLIVFILDMEQKLEVVEFFILSPARARLALSRVARQRMVGSAITTTTPVSRTDWYKETCTETSERKGLNCCQVHLNPGSICGLAHFPIFFLSGSFASNCLERDGECTDSTSLTIRTWKGSTPQAAWPRQADWWTCMRSIMAVRSCAFHAEVDEEVYC